MEQVGADSSSSSSSSSCNSSSSDDGHTPITKDWLFRASLIASAAQMDDCNSLLETENYLSNLTEGEDDPDQFPMEDEDDPDHFPAENEDDPNHFPIEEDEDKPDNMTNEVCAKTDEKDDFDIELHCSLCFKEDKPIKIVSNHNTGCPTCPTMTPGQKCDMIGPYWKEQAEMIFKMRYEENQQRRRRYART